MVLVNKELGFDYHLYSALTTETKTILYIQ